MNELIKLWNEKHDGYLLSSFDYQFRDECGVDKIRYILAISDLSNGELYCQYHGDDFIKLYNELPEIKKDEP